MPLSRYHWAFFLSQVQRGCPSGAWRKQLSYNGDFLQTRFTTSVIHRTFYINMAFVHNFDVEIGMGQSSVLLGLLKDCIYWNLFSLAAQKLKQLSQTRSIKALLTLGSLHCFLRNLKQQTVCSSQWRKDRSPGPRWGMMRPNLMDPKNELPPH